MVSAFENYLEYFHLLCFAHFLHRFLLTIYEYQYSDGILKKLIEKARSLTKKLRNSKILYILRKKVNECKIKFLKPKIDVETRWNLLYRML